jgi:hypothetical protein
MKNRVSFEISRCAGMHIFKIASKLERCSKLPSSTVRVQVVAWSKGYLHITLMLSKVYGPDSQLPLPALGGL